jgi:hypothetical protein
MATVVVVAKRTIFAIKEPLMAIVPSHVFSVYMLVVHICSINR